MAGFFGFGNFEKEGPGVRKDAPPKTAPAEFLEIFFANFWRLITVNLLYVLFFLPLVTGGFASAGITRVTRSLARRKHSFGVDDFMETVRKNRRQALSVGIMRLLVFAALGLSFWFYGFWMTGKAGVFGAGICLFLLCLLGMADFYVWTLIITFRFTVRQVFANSFRFVFLNLRRNLLCGILLTAVRLLFVAMPLLFSHPLVLFFTAVVYCCVFPGFRGLLVQFCAFPAVEKYIIDPYYEQPPDEDIALRRDLGLPVPEEPLSEEDATNGKEDTETTVFRD